MLEDPVFSKPTSSQIKLLPNEIKIEEDFYGKFSDVGVHTFELWQLDLHFL